MTPGETKLYSTAHDIRLNSQPFSKEVLYGAVGGDSTARKNFKRALQPFAVHEFQ